MYICERCGKEYQNIYASGRFCSESCSKKRTFSLESKLLISNSLKGKKHQHPVKLCKKCGRNIAVPSYNRHYAKCDGTSKVRPDYKKFNVCPFCGKNLSDKKHGNHIAFCKMNPSRTVRTHSLESSRKQSKTLSESYRSGKVASHCPSFSGRFHTEETKEKIRRKRLAYFDAHHDNTPWAKRSNCIPSYGERWLDDIFASNDIYKKYTVIREYPIHPYFIDFAFVNEKVAVEFDGGCHFKNGRKRIDHDIKRDNYLNGLGWRVFRIPYFEMQSFNIRDLIDFIGDSHSMMNDDSENRLIRYSDYKEKKIQIKVEKQKIIKEAKEKIKLNEIEFIKSQLLNSEIDFSKFGWVKMSAKIIGIGDQNVNRWMKRNMPDFYEKDCFKRKMRNGVRGF